MPNVIMTLAFICQEKHESESSTMGEEVVLQDTNGPQKSKLIQ